MRRFGIIIASVVGALAFARSVIADTTTAHLPFALPATFSGVTICSDCPGIRVTLSLAADGTYSLERDYMERNTTSTESGKWSYDASHA